MGDKDDADRLYFKQLLSGRDFAAGDVIAQQMRRIVSQQFVGTDQDTQDTINAAIDQLQQASA